MKIMSAKITAIGPCLAVSIPAAAAFAAEIADYGWGRFTTLFVVVTAFLSVGMLVISETGFAQSRSYCREYAQNYADRNSYYSSGGGVLGGAARGAIGGAILGGIAGNAGRGAAIGAGIGAIAGGAHEANSWQYYYDMAFSDCIRGR